MAEYDRGYKVPDWWLDEFKRIYAADELNDGKVIAKARVIDGREKSWDASRVSKMRNTGNSTIELTLAISRALEIPPAVFRSEISRRGS